MKLLLPLLLLAAGGVLGFIAWRSEEPEYVAPRLEDAPEAIPERLSGAVPAGYRTVSMEVEGMCCQGCPSTLYATLAGVEGVSEVAVEFVAAGVPGHAFVVAADAVSADSLSAAIASEKYGVRVLP